VTLLDPVRLLEHVHGHIGWLAAIALIHPAIVLRRPTRKAPWAVGLATGVVTLAGCLGAYIYGDYRDKLRQSIFQHARVIGYLFERKEHLAFGAVVLAWAGAAAYFAAPRASEATRTLLRTIAFRAFVAAAALAIVVACLGTVVSVTKSF
jgi:hypothetical protein